MNNKQAPDLDELERLSESAMQAGGDANRIGVGVSVADVRWLIRAARERGALRVRLAELEKRAEHYRAMLCAQGVV